MFQSIGEYNKIAFEIFKLVNEFIFIEENAKSTSLSEKITLMVLAEGQKGYEKPSIEGIVQNIMIKSELLNYVEINLNKLHTQERIELEGATLEVSLELRETIRELVNERNNNICKITSITCSSMHCFLGFLLTTGFKQERI